MDEDLNNKKRPAGSGTTTGKRREQRQAKQWSALQKADPPVTSRAEMEAQLEALKKATESAQKQLSQLEKVEKKPRGRPRNLGRLAPGAPPLNSGQRLLQGSPSLSA